MNKNQFKGRIHAMGGRFKALAGKLVGDRRLQVKADAQQSTGRAEERAGDIEQAALDSSETMK